MYVDWKIVLLGQYLIIRIKLKIKFKVLFFKLLMFFFNLVIDFFVNLVRVLVCNDLVYFD